MVKKSALNHYHLSRSLCLSMSHPLTSCVFPLLFPCGAEVMYFGTVCLLLDKASENDLSISVLSVPQHGWWEKEWDTVRAEVRVLWDCVHPAGFLHRFFSCVNQATKKKKKTLLNYTDMAVGSKVETKPEENSRKNPFTCSSSAWWQVFDRLIISLVAAYELI